MSAQFECQVLVGNRVSDHCGKLAVKWYPAEGGPMLLCETHGQAHWEARQIRYTDDGITFVLPATPPTERAG